MGNIIAFLFLKNLTPTFLRVLHVIWRYEKEVRMGNHIGVFPSRYKIAKEAKCSVESVKKFNTHVRKLQDFIKIKSRWNPKKRQFTSNSYEMTSELFDLMTMMNGLGYFKKKWEKIKEELYVKVSEDEDFILKKWKLLTKRMPAQNLKNGPNIEDSLIKERNINVPKSGAHTLVLNYGLSNQTLWNIDMNYPKRVVIDARSDYEWYAKRKKINSPDGLMNHLLKKSMKWHIQKNGSNLL